MIATIQTFVLAGAETSSTALTWASWVLARRPDVQDKLREECEAVLEEQPSMSVRLRCLFALLAADEPERLAGTTSMACLTWTPLFTRS